jgi:hypothetical protein
VARPIASLKPLRKTAARTVRIARVTRIWWSPRTPPKKGFSIACLAASVADSVM